MAAGKTSLCYILSMAVGDNVFMGGAMVTDVYGLPLEFRYTEPVRATKLQRILYGDVLEKYIHGDVIAANLAGRLEQKPELVIVTDAALLAPLESAGRRPVAVSAGRIPPLKEYGAQQTGDNELFLQLTDSGSPLRLRFAPAADEAREADAARVLTEAGRSMDVLEPMSRVEAAIRMLWEEAPEAPPA